MGGGRAWGIIYMTLVQALCGLFHCLLVIQSLQRSCMFYAGNNMIKTTKSTSSTSMLNTRCHIARVTIGLHSYNGIYAPCRLR